MAKKNGWVILALITISGILLHLNNVSRSVNGVNSWYSDPLLITTGSIYYVVFFALVTGYFLAKLLRNK